MTVFRILSASIAAAVTATSLLAAPAALAQDYWSQSCGDLWYRRNAIYAANGYCFKTERALRVFGNNGCRFYVEADVPMSRAERAEIDIIRSVEARKGC
ncbi:hypothetical protein Rvan_2664 [Rhodomicrobium vannielii ATCC 17100]|uniref:YARHG domain-containing protein n=1 Tax=Rhodomicrobium vannielii (strain ATCC 17100 / DSM 162 / LMG 4299 / NCIMB 10020 / ATH 3.1.1) TaxID=648757 RepID=E3I7F7_RHOVT|nr:YARHG domain-containing protein [Rhodomicrobium vannielii]ADP71876.1 hypothetical protein Rvan_2664 [Rhodomicrobium vannielii ATCC 17100]